jgi:hypothetical protein
MEIRCAVGVFIDQSESFERVVLFYNSYDPKIVKRNLCVPIAFNYLPDFADDQVEKTEQQLFIVFEILFLRSVDVLVKMDLSNNTRLPHRFRYFILC